MKKLVCLILALIMLISFCACGNSDPSEDDADGTPRETVPPVYYDKDEGRLIKEVNYNTNGLKYLTVYYDYDGHGRITKEMSMGINEAPEGYYTNEYDEKGNILLRVSYVALGPEEFVEEYRVSYEYNGQGLLVREKRTAEDMVLSITEYEYNDAGQCVCEKLYQRENFLAAEYSYGYDGKGRKSNCVRTDYMEEDTIENRYTHDAKDRLITDLKCDSNGNVIERIEYGYDENDNILKRSVYGSNGVLAGFVQYTYTYDDAGNYTKCVSTDSDGGNITTTEYFWAYSKG